MGWAQIIELLLAILAGGKVAIPVHVQDSKGSVDIVVSYDPKNGHIDLTNNK